MATERKTTLDLKQFLPYRLSVLEQQISQSIAQHYIDAFGLTRMEWRVMSTLAMFEGFTATEICQFTHLEKMQVSRALNGLAHKKLIAQKKHHQDKRSVQLFLTDKGYDIYQQIVPSVIEEESRIFSAFSEQEREQFMQLIHKLCLSLEK